MKIADPPKEEGEDGQTGLEAEVAGLEVADSNGANGAEESSAAWGSWD